METNEKVVNESIVNPFEENKRYDEYLTKLDNLRMDGENKVIQLKGENRDIKLNKLIDKDAKKQVIENNKKLIKDAKVVQKEKAALVKEVIVEAEKDANEEGKVYFEAVSAKSKDLVAKAKEVYLEAKKSEIADHKQRLAKVKEDYTNAMASVDKTDKKAVKKVKGEYAISLKTEKVLHSSKVNEIKSDYEIVKQKAKDDKYNAFSSKYSFVSKVRNGRLTIGQKFENWWRTYAYNFKLSSWLLKNALYIIVVAFFLFAIIYGSIQGKNLLTSGNILSIIGQSSVKVFYTLGVAGLILLAGTDLSIGRITGLGASFVNMLLATTVYTSQFGFTIDITGFPVAVKVILALLVSIILCTIFTSIAGFFSAKFKMHPFITTLSTQLLIFGIMMLSYADVSAFTMESGLRNSLRGQNYLNIIIAAVIVIAVVWFIWNKTRFGKNMYAVGGNAEAASVSGISVFWTTMGVFIMAGVLYGIGGFATALQGAGANANTGYGTELDAIAAAVIGGVSFSGGIGKISGAVVGTIIFTGMTYCLTALGFDPNIQYIFKGVLIMAAVCLDSIKYLKKK